MQKEVFLSPQQKKFGYLAAELAQKIEKLDVAVLAEVIKLPPGAWQDRLIKLHDEIRKTHDHFWTCAEMADRLIGSEEDILKNIVSGPQGEAARSTG